MGSYQSSGQPARRQYHDIRSRSLSCSTTVPGSRIERGCAPAGMHCLAAPRIVV